MRERRRQWRIHNILGRRVVYDDVRVRMNKTHNQTLSGAVKILQSPTSVLFLVGK